MTAQAGWYPDPSGDNSKLRFWDGNVWTNDFMDVSAVPQMQPAASDETVAETVMDPVQQSNAIEVQPEGVQGQQAYQPGSYQQQSQQGYQQTGQQQPGYQQPNYNMAQGGPYIVTGTDATLRMIAFIFFLISGATYVIAGIASFGIGLIPLAWVIPMTIRCWHIYKGERPNTIGFGVCTLLFVSLVSGILLLCSKKEK